MTDGQERDMVGRPMGMSGVIPRTVRLEPGCFLPVSSNGETQSRRSSPATQKRKRGGGTKKKVTSV